MVPRPLAPIVIAGLIMIIWGATPVATRLAVADLDPLFVGLLRTVFAGGSPSRSRWLTPDPAEGPPRLLLLASPPPPASSFSRFSTASASVTPRPCMAA